MSTIKIKRSGTSSQTPSSLEHGELALNYADGKLFYKDATDTITELSTGGGAGGGLDSAAIGGVEVFSYKTRLITNEDRFAIGQNANINNNGEGNIAIGFNADANGAAGAISLGKSTSAGGYQGIAIGVESKADQDYSLSIGKGAGANGGTKSGILIGYQCGLYMSNSPSEEGNVFIGRGAGSHSSLLQAANFFNRTVAIGEGAATKTTGETADAIAIGYRAGQQEMGSNSINIGRDAGKINAGDNSITINATGLEVSRTDQYAIDIRTSDSGSATYSTDSDWVFGATVNVNGDVNASGDITAFSTSVSSDPRLKTDIVKIDNAVEKVQQLNGVSWDWTRGGKSAGVLSTDVAAVLPEAVTTGKIFGEDTEYDKVNYNALIGLLVEAVKDLQSQVDELRAGE